MDPLRSATAKTPRALVTIAEAAERLRVSQRFVWVLVHRGSLRAIRLGRRCTRIDPAELDVLIEAARAKGGA